MKMKIPLLYTSILYICAFVLFLEWLYPVNVIGDVNNLTVFILFTIFCFFISMLQIEWYISMPLKGFGLLFIINSLFLTHPLFSKLWFDQLFMEISFNINVLFSQQWYELTPLFRSVLFLLLIWLMSYLLHYWFIVMKRIFLFVLLTIIYITVLDTFTIYEADAAIVRTFIVSFVALGMTNFFKEIDREAIRFSWLKKSPIWVVPLITIVLFSTLIGFAAPKFDPQWPDPVPFLKSTAENAGSSDAGSGVSKVGYGDNDSRLGGSFVQDYTPVFQAAAKDDHYWRVETKDVYTGKGWEKSQDPQYELQQNNAISLETFADSVETEKFTTTLDFQGNNNMEKLIYPYGISGVETTQNVGLMLDSQFGEIRTELEGSSLRLNNYTITYERPSFAIDELRKVSDEDPASLNERYTQLPDSLPERVGELAAEVTAEDDNRYDKARSLESYFSRNGFVYQISDVPVPNENQDYVDQFLFDSKAGYCDNYSTSMIVMLRSLDIPARWVKGFTSGEIVEEGENQNSYDIYEVTNSNAHSWVEVYFPDKGWVPFEPTQGFPNMAEFHFNSDSTSENDDEYEAPETESEQEQLPEENESETSSSTSNTSNFEVNWWYVLIGLTVILLFTFIIYLTRFRWKTVYLNMKIKNKGDAKTYQNAYHHLLNVLAHNGFPKDADQTLREYSKRIDSLYGSNTMKRLTSHYERILYKNELDTEEAVNLRQLWKNLIKRIMA
ncbi:protein of unknown function [Virgibacillus subterraneus]|uniref:Transglutaminase-like domain-containing protein n=1 Tax=Virgibacillus subterraneus TaxID=621109 RepID=A0A1H9J3R1_9BACI|nr:transglutaminase domain-containing protein [Virgibacillus subterraneus]SEQ81671.1 protein of unknown function [Virgibacillus subterraneus]